MIIIIDKDTLEVTIIEYDNKGVSCKLCDKKECNKCKKIYCG